MGYRFTLYGKIDNTYIQGGGFWGPDLGYILIRPCFQYLTRWFQVGSPQQTGISHDAVRILLHAGLMKINEEDGSHHITKSGFQFLLMETSSQVWYFILQYLDTVQSRNLSLAECLNFLFQLSFATLGKDYSTGGLTQGLLQFLQHLREFGLVYQRKRTAGRFYPTRLALNIASGEKKGLMVHF